MRRDAQGIGTVNATLVDFQEMGPESHPLFFGNVYDDFAFPGDSERHMRVSLSTNGAFPVEMFHCLLTSRGKPAVMDAGAMRPCRA
jgi:hypothetical protein